MKKGFILLLIVFSLSLLGVSFLFAQESQSRMEVEYPQIGDVRPTYSEGEGLSEYIVYMVYFLIALSVVITLFSLVRGGVSWLTARGDPMKIKEGKDRITGSIFGLIIILSSFVFLSSINPALIELEDLEVVEVEESFLPGIYLSLNQSIPEDIEDMPDVRRISASIRNLEDFNVRSIRIANQLDGRGRILGYYYAVVLHELRGFRGRCAVFKNDDPKPKDFIVPEGVSSISVIRVNDKPLEIGGMRAYARPDFNELYPSQSLNLHTESFKHLSIKETWSVDIAGSYALILASGNSWETTGDGCGVFLDSKPLPDLKEHHMNKCNPRKAMPFFSSYESCSTHYMALPLFK